MLGWIRFQYPARYPVEVRFERMAAGGDNIAECALRHRKFTIRINHDVLVPSRLHEAIELVIHEWAHARTWGRERAEHGRAWSREYGRLYAAWFDKE